jgi:hypothetical protein
MPRNSLNFSHPKSGPQRSIRRIPPRAAVRPAVRSTMSRAEILFIAVVSALCVFIILAPAS